MLYFSIMFTRPSKTRPTLIACTAAWLALTALNTEAAGRFSWLDEPVEAGLSMRSGEQPVHFDFELYRTGQSRWFSDERYAAFGSGGEGAVQDNVRLYGEWGSERTPGGPTAFDLLSSSLDPATRRRSLLGVSWEHRLDRLHSIAIAAEYGENTLRFSALRDDTPRRDTLATRAVVSWIGRFSGDWRPSLTSSVYLGDEAPRRLGLQSLGRTYYGFALGGELTLLGSHTPYVSLRLQRSGYDMDDPLNNTRQDYRSLLSAGWKWQVQRGLSLHAEASYGYSGERLDLLVPERSRLFFGTRFDFR